MEEEGARGHGRRSELGRAGGGAADLISALPEDLLLQVLVRLRCARAAACTSLVSRRWRGLWTRLPDLTFRGVTFRSTQAALGALRGAVNPAGISLLDIAFTRLEAAAVDLVPAEVFLLNPGYGEGAARVSSLIHAAAGLSPVDFSLSLPRSQDRVDVELPRFPRATSIHLRGENLRLSPPRQHGGGFPFPALERLSLSNCWVEQLAGLVLGCPRLRVFCIRNVYLHGSIDIRSESLQELSVQTDFSPTGRINIQAPMLKQLTVFFLPGANLSVSVAAPVLEKVSWDCLTYMGFAGLAPWGITNVSLRAAAITGEDSLCVRFLPMGPSRWFDAELNSVQQIEKHLITDFSVLDLKIGYDYGRKSTAHVFGRFVLHLLGMHRIRTATRGLQILFLRSNVKEEYPANCPCDEDKNWRSKTVSLINLEEVEINGFEGEDHEFDFLKMIFRCAPMLKRMDVWMKDEVTRSRDRCTKIYDIFKVYPFVECKFMQR